ncbi:beta-tubulin cofactor d [Plectosphaerella plurivora]|uniref:Beta-tubulin cofactor d n=1 Tax=Plectosphaerella plurivora TaxID=936078 RepID=A0A9P8V2I2_9PEZI|nr:beta-tubulin cofactor d [Plectosphaerella plurivora]
MEDAPEDDRDIKLQKVSADFIADFNRSLHPFLRKPDGTLRSRVRMSETTRLTSNIRGPSVVLRFLPVEARHLEPLLAALESAERRAARPSILAVTDSSRAQAVAAEPSQREWTWEERYVVLLWLSHLLLAPFDLSTISSTDPDESNAAPLKDLDLPANLPGITARLLPIGIKYLASPGKERDGARALLVRIAMRRDMQKLGILDVLVRWALRSLRPSKDTASEQPYFYIGVLSFLGGVLKSSVNTSDLDTHLPSIFAATHALSTDQGPVLESIRSYAVARKMMIKVIRSVAVQILRRQPQDMAGTEVVESSISYLLECLADNDTPVRFAASKALSVITLKLDPDMAEQVVEAVLESLNRNVITRKVAGGTPVRDLGAVDPLEWHGLILTLSNLLYRRSPPAHQLADIIHGLLLGISFEKRSTSGGSIGTNVRDAACFGIWALARRYTTEELLAVPTSSVIAARTHPSDASVLQVLATELVVAACLDSAGNIRRGASAALQELIGRHPDTVEKGIWVVQAVDYHAVALRSRAIHEVALKATKLADQYGKALLQALLGWRGIGDPDAAARRVAGHSFGTLTSALSFSEGAKPLDQFKTSVQMILEWLGTLQVRQVDERHGLVLCLAAVLDQFPAIVDAAKADSMSSLQDIAQSLLRDLGNILQNARDTTYRRPELISEAACRLIISSLPLFQLTIHHAASTPESPLRPGYEVVCPKSTTSLSTLVSSVDSLDITPSNIQKLLSTCKPVIDAGLGRAEKEAVSASSEAALVLLAFSSRPERNTIIKHWADAVRQKPTSRTGHSTGYFFALTMAHPIAALSRETASADDVAAEALQARWHADNDIDTRVAILKSLTQSIVLRDHPLGFLDVLAAGLNDYTTNARGDVGSHVRLEALRATKIIWQNLDSRQAGDEALQAALSKLYLRVLRLAAEKLDRVRTEAHSVLTLTLLPEYAAGFTRLTFSSRPYFHHLLSLSTAEGALQPRIATIASSDPAAWMAELLAGFVTSADTGNEDLVIASRAALTSFCDASDANLEAVCTALVANLSTYQQQNHDRVLVPTLEIVAFLFRVGVFQTCPSINLRKLCLLVQKAGYKTGNVRKLEACIRVYGCVASLEDRHLALEGDEGLSEKRRGGVAEAKKRLGALMSHPWPRVRSLVVDELWRLVCDTAEDGTKAKDVLKGVDWGRADKNAVKKLVSELQLG